MAFNTVNDVITEVRTLLQDTDSAGFRYSNSSIYQALNEGLLEAARLRPDFFRGIPIPQYGSSGSGDPILFPPTFIPALINYVCGRIQLRDDEATNDQRASVFIMSFKQTLAPGAT